MISDHAKMAGRAMSLDVELAGVIPAAARSELVKELVKFILYQRNQIPMYFDQLADSLARESQSVENSSLRRPPLVGRQHKSSRSQQQELVKTVEALFQIVRDFFESGDLIKQVLIILGSNIILPKDAYLLHFPTEFYEGPSVTARSCVQSVFRTFYNNDFLSGAVPLSSSTNLFLFFLAPRNCDHTRFNLIPQLAYSLPSAGALYEVNLICTASTVTLGTAELGSPNGKELNISGIHPLDNSVTDSAADDMDISTVHLPTSDDYVWFQAPVTVKGYREKVHDTVGSWVVQ